MKTKHLLSLILTFMAMIWTSIAQVSALATKGWTALDSTEKAYKGSQVEVQPSITLKTAKAKDAELRLAIFANGDYTVEGAQKINSGVYTLKADNKTIVIKGKVTSLICEDNQLTSLDASHNPHLKSLKCSRNRFTTLDFSGNPELYSLFVEENEVPITKLNLSKNTKLSHLTCSFSKVQGLDLRANKALQELNCEKCGLATLDLTQNVALKTLHCYNNQLTTLNLSKNTQLVLLGCTKTLSSNSICRKTLPSKSYSASITN